MDLVGIARQGLDEEPDQALLRIAAKPADIRTDGIARKRRQLGQTVGDFDRRLRHVGFKGEGQVDEGIALTDKDPHFLEPGQARKQLLLRFDDFRFHFQRRGRAPEGGDIDLRPFGVREELDRQAREGDHAHQHDQCNSHHDGSRIVQGQPGQRHGNLLACLS